MNKKIKIWVGKRESDILSYNIFDYSITFYGSNQNGNFSFCVKKRIASNYSGEFIEFTINNMCKLLKKHNQNVEFHFYNNSFAYKIINKYPDIQRYIANMNSLYSIDLVRHKTLSRLWLSNTTKTPAFAALSKDQCNFDTLTKKFGKYDSFVIQKNFSGGGDGTYMINVQNKQVEEISTEKIYLASPYYEPNESYSCILLIDDNNCIVFAVLYQNLSLNGGHISYIGNYSSSNEDIVKKIKKEAIKIATKLQSLGYKGICGLDFISYKDDILFIEANPRYLGSTYYINYVLKTLNMPSLFELNSLCFENRLNSIDLFKLESIEFSYKHNYIQYHTIEDLNTAKKLLNQKKYILYSDGFENAEEFEPGVYLCRYIDIK